MAAISVRDLDDHVAHRLKVRAARHGRSMEAEVRSILVDAVEADDDGPNLVEAMRRRFAAEDGIDLVTPRRQESPRAADLSTTP